MSKSFALAACCFSCVALPLGANANTSLPKDLYKMSLGELLELPITGSTKTEETTKTVPAAVTVYTHQQIARMGFTDLYELLNLVPGYQSQRSGEYPFAYAFSSRGRRTASQSNEVMLLIDGRLMIDPRTGRTSTTLPSVSLNQIERVEFIRGPGSAIYGSNAFTGVINIITRKDENIVGITAGTSEMVGGHFLASEQWDDWAVNAYFEATDEGGQDYNVQDTFSASRIKTNDPHSVIHFDGSVAFKQTLLRARYDYAVSENFYSVGTISNGFNKLDSRLLHLSLEQTINWSSNWSSEFYVAALNTDFQFNTQITAPGALAAISSPSSNDPSMGIGKAEGEAFTARWSNNVNWLQEQDLQFGIEWRSENDVLSRAYQNYNLAQLAAGDLPIDYYGDFGFSFPFSKESRRYLTSAYAQLQHSFASRTYVTVGARYDDYEDVGGKLSPRFGVVQELNDIHSLKVLYGEAFRAPGQNETGLINNPLIVGNPDLDHETVRTWDLIWLAQWQKIYVNTGVFFNHYEDAIRSGLIGSTRTFVQENHEDRKGIELEVRYDLANQWQLGASYTQFSKQEDYTNFEAYQLGSFLIQYDQAKWDWNIAAVFHGSSEMLTPGNVLLELDSYWLVNTKLRYKPSAEWTAFLQVKNLFDEASFSAVESNSLTEGIPGRLRDWAIGANFHF